MKAGLVAGMNHFANFPESTLAGCVPDAGTMQAILEGKGCDVVKLVDAEAADYAILNQIQEFYQQALKVKSYYVGLAFSSHGTHYPDKSEVDGLGEALCCANLTEKDDNWASGFIKDKTFRNYLNRFPPYGIVEVFFDTCYSGGMDRVFGLAAGIRKHAEQTGVDHPVKNRFLHNPGNPSGEFRMASTGMTLGLNPNIVMWQACSEAQTSADAYIAGGAHGAFTYFFNEAYRRNPEASRVDILVMTRKALTANGYDQFPRLKCWNARAQTKVGA